MRRRIVGPQPATISEIVNLTARQLTPKRKGYSRINFGESLRNKDWMNPKVKIVLERYADRHLFSNPLSSRAAFETFVVDAARIALAGAKSPVVRDNSLKRHLLNFAFNVKTDRSISTGEKIKLVRISLESLKHKLDAFSEMSKANWSKVKIESDSKRQIDSADTKYYIDNARDAMGHIMFEHVIMTQDGVVQLIRCAKSLETTFLRE